ncbi:MAG: hypothetical protein JWR17_108 [Pseudomonas sp.]|jgi:hypothetical protein|nr:hypothetical protein [Pseudomonas sp.]
MVLTQEGAADRQRQPGGAGVTPAAAQRGLKARKIPGRAGNFRSARGFFPAGFGSDPKYIAWGARDNLPAGSEVHQASHGFYRQGRVA